MLSSFLFLLTSCTIKIDRVNPAATTESDMMDDIIKKIEKKDTQGIYDLFSDSVKEEIPDLKDQIESIQGYYKGECKNRTSVSTQTSGDYNYGTMKQKIVYTKASIFTTESRYHLAFQWYQKDKDNPKNVGLHFIYFEEFLGWEASIAMPTMTESH